MRKLIFWSCVVAAVGAGLIIGAVERSLGLGLLFGFKLGVLGAVVGAFVSNIGRKSPKAEFDEELAQEEFERVARMGSNDNSPDEMTANYWRDKGHPAFMNPEDYDPRA